MNSPFVVRTEISASDLLDHICSEWTDYEMIEFVKEMNMAVDTEKFTKTLYRHFRDEMMNGWGTLGFVTEEWDDETNGEKDTPKDDIELWSTRKVEK